MGECSTHHISGRLPTYANHGDTENTEDLNKNSVWSLCPLWLAYVDYAMSERIYFSPLITYNWLASAR